MSLFLFRHGETRQSKFAMAYGDEELTAEILPEAALITEKIGRFLTDRGIAKYYSSEYLRCRQTATIIEQLTGEKFNFTPLLNEYRVGEFADLRRRSEEFLQLVEKEPGKTAVCTHGAVIAAIKYLSISGNFDSEQILDYPLTGVVWELDIVAKTIKEHNFRPLRVNDGR